MIVVIDYRAGNLYNVGNALKHLGREFVFSGKPETVRRASRVILPGQGAAGPAMQSLREQGLIEVLRELPVPFLGICLGLQLLYERSEEDDTVCLGVIPGRIRKFDARRVKVPQIGWNQLAFPADGEHGLFAGIPAGSYFYFVHSFYAPAGTPYTLATADYAVEFTAAAERDNFRGVQFHPERSGERGLRLLENFLDL